MTKSTKTTTTTGRAPLAAALGSLALGLGACSAAREGGPPGPSIAEHDARFARLDLAFDT